MLSNKKSSRKDYLTHLLLNCSLIRQQDVSYLSNIYLQHCRSFSKSLVTHWGRWRLNLYDEIIESICLSSFSKVSFVVLPWLNHLLIASKHAVDYSISCVTSSIIIHLSPPQWPINRPILHQINSGTAVSHGASTYMLVVLYGIASYSACAGLGACRAESDQLHVEYQIPSVMGWVTRHWQNYQITRSIKTSRAIAVAALPRP